MELMLDGLLLTEEEYSLGPDIWTTDKAKFDDPFPEDFSAELMKKHAHILSSNPDSRDGW
jgi:hypothetical protein